MEGGRSETSHYPAVLRGRHCKAATYPVRAGPSTDDPSTQYRREIASPRSPTRIPSGHARAEAIEAADQAAKEEANRPPGTGPKKAYTGNEILLG